MGQLTEAMLSNTSLPPGSFGLPVVGETLAFMRDPDFVAKRQAEYGPIFRTHVRGRPAAVMLGYAANRFILASGFDHFSCREGMPPTTVALIGDGLVVQDGPAHTRARQLLAPAFHRRALETYFLTMRDVTEQYLSAWSRKGSIDWSSEARQLTFEIASMLIAGLHPGDEVERLGQLFDTVFCGLLGVPINIPGTKYHRAFKARAALMDFIEGAIRRRQEHPAHDAVSLLLYTADETGATLSLEEIKAQLLMLLLAGHETTAKMLIDVAVLLALHPDVLERARAEQRQFDQELTFEQLTAMPYLDHVLLEVGRLRPPAKNGFRSVKKAFEFGGYRIPAGWRVIYRTMETHRDPQLFRDPERFDPDRFGPDRAEQKQHAFSLITFGGGSRLCLGQAFAQMELKVIAAQLLRRYRWSWRGREIGAYANVVGTSYSNVCGEIRPLQ